MPEDEKKNYYLSYGVGFGLIGGTFLAIFLGLFLSNATFLAIGIIWMAHIGMDRLVGFGLKYPTHFKDNHLNRL